MRTSLSIQASLLAAFAFFLFGSTALIVKTSSLQSLDLVFHRMAITALGTFLLGRLWRRRSLSIGRMAFAGVLLTSASIFLNMLCLFGAFRRIPIPIAVALFFSGPIFSLFLRALIGQTRLRRRDLISAVIALLGLACLAFEAQTINKPDQIIGYALALLGGLLFGLVPIFEVLTAKLPALTTLFIQSCFAVLALLPFANNLNPFGKPDELLSLLVMGVGQTLLPFLLWWRALRVQPSLSPFFAFIDPITAIVVGILVFNEDLSFRQWSCAALLTLAVVVQVAPNGRPSLRKVTEKR